MANKNLIHIPVQIDLLDQEHIIDVRLKHWACNKFDCDCDEEYERAVDSELNFGDCE